jgi:hypothetical protein
MPTRPQPKTHLKNARWDGYTICGHRWKPAGSVSLIALMRVVEGQDEATCAPCLRKARIMAGGATGQPGQRGR